VKASIFVATDQEEKIQENIEEENIQEMNVYDAHVEEENIILKYLDPPINTNPSVISSNPSFKMNPLSMSLDSPLKDTDNTFLKMESITLHNFP